MARGREGRGREGEGGRGKSRLSAAAPRFGEITLPWGVCIPQDAPVNLDSHYPNWGVASGDYASLRACKLACQ